MSESPDEKARPRRDARDGQEVESHRQNATDSRPDQAGVSVADHHAARQALNAACVAVTLCAGRQPEEVAAEIAGRAVTALKGEGQRP